MTSGDLLLQTLFEMVRKDLRPEVLQDLGAGAVNEVEDALWVMKSAPRSNLVPVNRDHWAL